MKGIERSKSKYKAAIIVAMMVMFSIFLFQYDPNKLIESLGVTNGYIFLALLGLFGGLSLFTSSFFYVAVISLTVAGFNSLGLAIVGGITLFIGDSIVYYVGYHSEKTLKNEPKWFKKMQKWLSRQNVLTLSVFTYMYGLTPLPNDILMLLFSLMKHPYKYIWLPVLVGDISIIFAVSFFAKIGISLIS